MYMLGRKKDLEHRMFSDRRDLSAQYRQKNVDTVTIPEIIEFLKLSARSHKRIYKYTKLSRVGVKMALFESYGTLTHPKACRGCGRRMAVGESIYHGDLCETCHDKKAHKEAKIAAEQC